MIAYVSSSVANRLRALKEEMFGVSRMLVERTVVAKEMKRILVTYMGWVEDRYSVLHVSMAATACVGVY